MIWRTAFSLAARGRLSILIFHRVLAQPDPMLPLEPSAVQFDALMRHVKARFNVLPLAVALNRLADGTLPSAAVSITFDDGYADNLSIAAPILRGHGVPATVFVATGYLDGRPMWNDMVIEAFRFAEMAVLDLTSLGLGRHSVASTEERRLALDRVLASIKRFPGTRRDTVAAGVLDLAKVGAPVGLMLTRDAVRRLPTSGLDVGAHTVSHPILAVTGAEEAWREISESKRELEVILGRPLSLFAYPNGRPDTDYCEEHVRMVREAGFAAAVNTSWGAADRACDMFQLPRFTPWTLQPTKFDYLMLKNLGQTPRRAGPGEPGLGRHEASATAARE